MRHSRFVHLHVHSEYSLLDGMCRIDRILEKAHKLKMPAVAVTDHGNMCSAVDFYQKAREAGIKPIIGMEGYVAPGSRTDRKVDNVKDASYHLTLLAKDIKGYKNLIKLSSIGWLEGFYYKPRLDKEVLKQYSEGLIALSGCLKGELAYFVNHDQPEKAASALEQYLDIFGKDNFFLEIQDHGISEQRKVNEWLINASKKYELDLAATNDSHYVDSYQSYIHEVLLCIQTATNLQDPKRIKFATNEFYFKTEDEMRKLFPEVPQAIENTVKIAEMCNLELDFTEKHLPMYNPPDGETRENMLKRLCSEGVRRKYGKATDEIKKRLDHELEIIFKMNYASYFLIVWDFIHFAKENMIPVGPGRGSAAGSLVSYLLDITNIDPLKYGLVFERFLNPSRVTLPDIDIDFCDKRRDEIIDYVRKKYGKDNVAQIMTFGTMGAKGVIRDVSRGLGLAYSEADRIAKLIPNELNITLKRSLELEPRLEAARKDDPRVAKLLEIAFELEGIVRNASTHAAGVVISSKPLTEYVPLSMGNKGEVVTQYSMGPLEKIGMLKMDFLGLKTLSVVKDTIQMVDKLEEKQLNIDQVQLDDGLTFDLLNKADTIGIFQLESTGMRDLARRIGLNNFNDMIALVALFRPGPMHMLEDYVARKHGRIPIKYDHELLEPVLKDTYGVMLYQEQVMQCANIIGSFDMAEADNLRRIMGKKITDKMEQQRDKFIKGARKKGLNHNLAEKIFETMANFAGYGFNKSHSAAYAKIAYQTAYLKAHWPVFYMAALLTSEMNNTDKLARYIDECEEMGVEILPPDLNQSNADFTPILNHGDGAKKVLGHGPSIKESKGSIRFGLAAVKNVGLAAVKSILEVRNSGGNFVSFENFIERVDSRSVNKKVIESLIKCGAMDFFGYSRKQLVLGLDSAMDFVNRRLKIERSAQKYFFDILDEGSVKESLKLPEVPEWPQSQLLSFEKELLSFYVTGHPLTEYEHLIKWYNTASSRQLAQLAVNTKVRVGGIITAVKNTVTKRDSKKMAIVTLEDLDGIIEIVVYPDTYEQYSQYIEDNKPVIVTGQAQAQEDKARVIASELVPLEDAPNRYVNLFQINLFDTHADDDILKQLKQIIRRYPGNCPISFCMNLSTGEKITLAVNGDLKVKPDPQLISGIEDLLGEGNTRLVVAK